MLVFFGRAGDPYLGGNILNFAMPWRECVAITPPPRLGQPRGVRAHRTSPDRPLTGLLEGCTPWGVLWELKSSGRGVIHCLRPAVKWVWSRRPCLGVGFPGHLVAGDVYLVVALVACRPSAAGSDCILIHAGTLGTLLLEDGPLPEWP